MEHQKQAKGVSAVAGMAAALVGCAMELPTSDLILDERPLAIRVEAAGDAADPVRTEVLPLERVRLRPWIVTPQGPLDPTRVERELEPLWLACALPPRVGLFGCLSSKLPLDAAAIPPCPEPDLAALDPSALLASAPPSPCRIAASPTAEPEYTVPLDPTFLVGGDVELTMVAHRPGRGTSEDCLRALVSEADELPEACLYASQRLTIGPASALYEAAAALGVTLGAPPPVTAPDTHPRIQSFTIEAFLGGRPIGPPVTLVEPGQTVQAPPGARLELRTEAAASDLQTYYSTGDAGVWDEQRESYTGRWFRTWGTLWSPQSDDPTSFNRWELVPGEQDTSELPPGGRATLFYVLRDGRQGVTWWWFDVEVTPSRP